MSQSVWLDDKIPCSANVSGKAFAKMKSVDFVFRVGSKEVGRAKGDIQGGLAKCEWTNSAGPEEGKLSADVGYCLEVGGKKYENFPEVIRVFRHHVKVKVTGPDQKPLAGVPCELTQVIPHGFQKAGTPVHNVRRSGKDGVVDFDLMYPAEPKFTFAKPYVLEKWLKKDAVEWHAQVRRVPYELKLVWPSGGKVHKQFVNLDANSAHPEAGPVLRVKVRPRDPELARKGDLAYLEAEFADLNDKLRTPPPGNPGPGKKLHLEARLGEDLTATFEVPVGVCGGDQVKVKVGSRPDGATMMEGVRVENWRRLHYQVSGLDVDGATLRTYESAGAKVFLDLKRVPLWPAARNDGSFQVDAAAFGESGAPLLVIPPKSLFGKYGTRSAPADLHYVFCDYFAEEIPVTLTIGATAEDRLEWVDGSSCHGTRVRGSAYKKRMAVLRHAMKGGDSIARCTWTIEGGANQGRSGSIESRDRCVIVNPKNLTDFEILLRFPPELTSLLGKGDSVALDLELSKVKFSNGVSNGPRLAVARCDSAGRRSAAEIASTFVHECGHALKMVVKKDDYKVPGMSSPSQVHGRAYVNRGHPGPHCADGIDQRIFDAGDDFDASARGTCVMWGAPWHGRSTDFCERCARMLVPVDLRDLWSGFRSMGSQRQ